ncbi:MAG: autotransporter-associated beta strand repeat protein, partial [Verrucomicrobia bacterium]|nr:autotransporter-associated beta strand repeat protein [Verrucomicrobiota bacterium]
SLTVVFTYDGGSTIPVNAGSYTVQATIDDVNYEGSVTGTLVIHPALAVVTLGNLSQTFDGSGKSVSVGTNPGGVSFAVSYPGGTLPVNAGSYAVSADVTNPNYTGSATGTLVIHAASASVVLGNLSQAYDGSAKSIVATTTPAGISLVVSYPGGTAPVNAGSYAVSAAITDPNYTGSATGTLVIQKAAATVTLGNLNQVYDGSAKTITTTTNPSGVSLAVSYSSGTPPTAVGSYAVAATVTDPNYTGSATGTLVISTLPTTLSLAKLHQAYNGLPRPIEVVVTPSSTTYTVTYDGSATPPTLPGSYAVVATLTDPNRSGSASGVLEITITALVNHPTSLNGNLDGSMQILSGESFALNGNSMITGDLLMPGTPTIRKNGNATYGVLIDGSGTAAPANYTVTLNGNVVVARMLRRITPIALPVVAAPPSPTGTRSVSVNKSGQAIGDFATLRDLTLNGNPGMVAVPAGTYGNFTANGGGFVLGVAGSTTPTVYSFQNITLNGNAIIDVAGPVIIKLANGVSFNGSVGTSAHPEWLTLQVANGSVTLNGNVSFYGTIVAPNGTITINGNSKIRGQVSCDKLVINGNGLLDDSND